MIRVHGLSGEQFAALMRLAEDNQSFDRPDRARTLRVIEGGRVVTGDAGRPVERALAAELQVVG